MRETIPEDLKALYNWTGACSQIEKNQLIERVAKAEARNKVLEEALSEARRFVQAWPEVRGESPLSFAASRITLRNIDAALREDR